VFDRIAAGSLARAHTSRFTLKLLSGFELRLDDRAVSMALSAQRLTAFLALHGRAALRTYVAGSLWGEFSDDRSHRSLRTALWRVRRSGPSLIVSSDSQVGLREDVSVDIRDRTATARRLLAGHPLNPDDLDPLRLSDDLLPDWYDEWVVMERERYRQLRLHALETVCVRLTALGRYGEAVEAGLSAVAGEPLRESANLALLNAHLAEGNRSEALRAYERYRGQLAAELSLRPSRKLEDLVRGICGPAVDGPSFGGINSHRSQAIRMVAAGQPTEKKGG
jgi:DNA-binding SARP family transcriptional activator